MTAWHQGGLRLAVAEARDGGVPEVRALARQMLDELQTKIRHMTTWTRAWAKTGTRTRSG